MGCKLLYVHRKMKNKSKAKTDLSILYISCAFLVLITLSLFNLALYLFKSNHEVLGANSEVSQEIIFWHDFLTENPSYIDGWLELTKLEYEKGNFASSQEALRQAEIIDPNSEELKKLKIDLDL